MKRFSLAALLLTLLASTAAHAGLEGTERSVENIWMVGDRKISFGPKPNASIQYTGGNIVIDVSQGGGQLQLPDGLDLVTGSLSFGTSAVFEGTTADSFETTLTVVDPTADRTISLPNVSGTTLLSTAAQDAAASIKGVANGIEFEGATADTSETTISFTDPTADRSVVFADGAGTVMLSSLATNAVDVANAVTGASNSLLFEGLTADGFETSLTVADPGSDTTATIPNQTGTILLSTAAQDAANSVKGAANGFEFEGSTADTNELTVSAADAGADVTVTIPAVTGTICVGGALVATAGANTACTTTCGAGKCCGAFDSGTSLPVGCASATADVCTCMP